MSLRGPDQSVRQTQNPVVLGPGFRQDDGGDAGRASGNLICPSSKSEFDQFLARHLP